MKSIKQNIREAIRTINKLTLDKEAYNELSSLICAKIENLEIWNSANKIALYSALPDEPSLQLLLDKYSSSKELYLPKILDDSLNMQFFRYYNQDLGIGKYGIKEPPSSSEMINGKDLDLIIVPAVAFTKEGNRLGRGKGFYDKYLQDLDVFCLGVTFPFRILPSLPKEPWDRCMNLVLEI